MTNAKRNLKKKKKIKSRKGPFCNVIFIFLFLLLRSKKFRPIVQDWPGISDFQSQWEEVSFSELKALLEGSRTLW